MNSEINSPRLARGSNRPNIRSMIELFTSLRTPDDCSTLHTSPTNLDIVSIILVICLFIGRTIKHFIGLGTPLTPIKSGPSFDTISKDTNMNTSTDRTKTKNDTDIRTQLFALPPISLMCPLTITHQDIELFNHCLTLTNTPSTSSSITNSTTSVPSIKRDPALISIFLASLSEPAMLLLLSKRHCPIRPLGAVNVRNRFEILDWNTCQALVCDQTPTSSNQHDHNNKLSRNHPNLIVTAKFPRPAKKVKRGLEIVVEVVISAFDAGYADSSGSGNSRGEEKGRKDIFRQEFTLLQFVKWQDEDKPRPSPPPQSSSTTNTTKTSSPSSHSATHPPSSSSSSSIKIPIHAPNPWSKLSKDYNPIHLSNTIAKLLLGSSGKIAHGNHVVAMCLNHFHHHQNHDNDELIDLRSRGDDDGKWCTEITFKRPIVLPATVTITSISQMKTSQMTQMTRGNDYDASNSITNGRGYEIINQKDGKPVIEIKYW